MDCAGQIAASSSDNGVRGTRLTRDDFMFSGYDAIGEPLNLCETGQPWLIDIYRQQRGARSEGGDGLVLGATPWLGRLLGADHRRVVMVDMSEAMLRMSCSRLSPDAPRASRGCFEFIRASWSTMPDVGRSFAAVVGDNSFSYLPFPGGWKQLCEDIAARMLPGATLLARICSVPPGHRRLSSEGIVRRFMNQERLNYTEVRATLLFAQWEPRTFGIRTEDALEEFEARRGVFEALLAKFGATPDNDLETVRKYRGTDAVYYAPPLTEALAVIGNVFRVSGVHFGPYAMPDYFPLIVGTRR